MFTIIEWLSFIANGLCVYFIIRRKTVNWVVGLIGIILLMIVFGRKELWGQFLVQVVYLVQSIIGYVLWRKHENEKREVQTILGFKHKFKYRIYGVLALSFLFVLCTTLYGISFKPINFKLLDYALCIVSIIANYLLIKRFIENWLFWIMIDLYSTPLFIEAGMTITAMLYGLFLALSVIGCVEWIKEFFRIEKIKRYGNKVI